MAASFWSAGGIEFGESSGSATGEANGPESFEGLGVSNSGTYTRAEAWFDIPPLVIRISC